MWQGSCRMNIGAGPPLVRSRERLQELKSKKKGVWASVIERGHDIVGRSGSEGRGCCKVSWVNAGLSGKGKGF